MRACWTCTMLFCVSAASAGDNWPQFRGPSADGHSDSTGLPLTWSDTENVRWKTAIDGRGWSSPVVWGDQIWLTTATEDGQDMYAVCVAKDTGRIVHQLRVFHNESPAFCHPLNSYASPTPAVESGRVYVHFGSYGTACLRTSDGQVLWTRRDLPCDHFRGPGSSPILFEDKLIVHYDGYDYQYVIAFDKATGKTAWKVDRNHDFGTDDGDLKKAFSTPMVVTVAGQRQLISPGSRATFAYDPHTGREFWRVRFRGFSSTAMPLFGHGLFFLNTGFSRGELFAVRAGGSGDITDTHVQWSTNKGVPSKPSELLVDDCLYMVDDGGTASCLEAKTGATVWSERIRGQYSASPLYADGRIYFFSHDGRCTVIRPGRTYELLATNRLPDGFMASPAVTGKALILRTKTHLYRIER